jgi:hypothetical protein
MILNDSPQIYELFWWIKIQAPRTVRYNPQTYIVFKKKLNIEAQMTPCIFLLTDNLHYITFLEGDVQ